MLRKKNFIFILFAIIFLMFPLLCGAEELEKIIPDISDFEMKENYSSYLERYREAPRPEIEIIVPAEKFSETNMDIEILSDYQGVSGKAIKTAEKGRRPDILVLDTTKNQRFLTTKGSVAYIRTTSIICIF